jgi:hypothetical protein
VWNWDFDASLEVYMREMVFVFQLEGISYTVSSRLDLNHKLVLCRLQNFSKSFYCLHILVLKYRVGC